MNLEDHPTVKRFRERPPVPDAGPRTLDAAWLRQLCFDCGADDAGLVEVGRPALDDQRADILRFFPPAVPLSTRRMRPRATALRRELPVWRRGRAGNACSRLPPHAMRREW